MSQILIQDQSLLSRLARISPQWAAIIEVDDKGLLYIPKTKYDHGYVVDNTFELLQYHCEGNYERLPKGFMNLGLKNCCIVGEAHGWNDRYRCGECDILSGRLYGNYRANLAVSFTENVREFVEHFESSHHPR